MYKKEKMVCIMFLFIYFGLHYTLLCDKKNYYISNNQIHI